MHDTIRTLLRCLPHIDGANDEGMRCQWLGRIKCAVSNAVAGN